MIHLRRLMEKNRSEGRRKIVPSSSSSSSSSYYTPSFGSLPVDCISNIISFTSPVDAGVAAVVSKTFASAVESNLIWEKFLPADSESLIPHSRVFSSKKELYLSLCDDPILIEDGKKSFWLEKTSGKRCIMLPAKELSIQFDFKEDPTNRLEWIPSPEDRIQTVALLRARNGFTISYDMNHPCVLSPRTSYAVFIVLKKADDCSNGLEGLAMEASVVVGGREYVGRYLGFDLTRGYAWDIPWTMVKPKAREDGWTELELGEFVIEGGLNNDEIEITASLGGENRKLMYGLIIQGIEIRPTKR